ncbi:unnamed protein product [Lepeophtheirus salmonis]|uniref:(salmon louse) hypothetical protein n=1 Tax=Lepeophtheirus salmonis TaxID=72036 RepID=A0A7R8CTN9_LEPSM|nr:unnamed protein product [Lepeophtheirus salmonis]CAF2928097.1 unnamed protein product [Lepeophtheirus salmonis]
MVTRENERPPDLSINGHGFVSVVTKQLKVTCKNFVRSKKLIEDGDNLHRKLGSVGKPKINIARLKEDEPSKPQRVRLKYFLSRLFELLKESYSRFCEVCFIEWIFGLLVTS